MVETGGMEAGPLAAEVPAGDSAPVDGAAGAAHALGLEKETEIESPPPPPPPAKTRRVEQECSTIVGCGKVFYPGCKDLPGICEKDRYSR